MEEAVTLLDETEEVDDSVENKVFPGVVEFVVNEPPVVSSFGEDGVAPETEVEGCDVSNETLDGKDEPGYVVYPDTLAFDIKGVVPLIDETGKVDDTLGTMVCPGDDAFKLGPFKKGTSVRTKASKLIIPDANSLNASTSTRNCNMSEPPSPTATCTAESGSSPPHVSKLPRRAQPLGRSTYTSTLGNTLPHTPALGRPARSTYTKAWSPAATTREDEEFTLNRTLDADTHGTALLLGGDA
jgi:hypothetical protein